MRIVEFADGFESSQEPVQGFGDATSLASFASNEDFVASLSASGDSLQNGSLYYNTTDHLIHFYTNGTWKTVSLPPSAGPVRSDGSTFTTGSINLVSEVTGLLGSANGGTGANLSGASGPIRISSGTMGTGNTDLSTETTGTLPLLKGGTGQTSASGAINALLPAQAGNANKFLTTDGSSASWASNPSSPTEPNFLNNLGLSVTVASGAMNVNLKQNDGTSDPTAGAPTTIAFRNASATSGAYSTINATAATSLVIPSGATLATSNATAAYLWVYALNNSGTIELAISRVRLDEGSIVSTTAISAAASSNSIIYSTIARSNVAIRLIGRINSTQAVAGTWATAPNEVSLAPTIESGEYVGARYSTSATASIVNQASENSEPRLQYNTKIFDSHNSVTTGASWAFTAPKDGTYRVNASVTADGGATTSTFILKLFKNNSAYNLRLGRQSGGEGLVSSGMDEVKLLKNETVDIRLFQNTGGSYTPSANCFITISRIGAYQ